MRGFKQDSRVDTVHDWASLQSLRPYCSLRQRQLLAQASLIKAAHQKLCSIGLLVGDSARYRLMFSRSRHVFLIGASDISEAAVNYIFVSLDRAHFIGVGKLFFGI